MTISEYITKFLGQFSELSIDTNHVKDGSDRYGLFKSPNRDKKDMLDGSYEITEYYQFLARQVSVSNSERKGSDEWMEDLTYSIDDYKMKYQYPLLDKSRTVMDISVTGIPYPMETTDEDTLYQMSLKITYSREMEEI